jgi:phosphatidylglycerol lysyltransferase
VLFAVALSVLHRELRGFHYHDVLLFLARLPGDRVALSLGLTLAGYLALTGYDTLGVRWIGRRIPYPRTAFAAFVSTAMSNTLGMPLLTGMPLRARLYTGWGLNAVDIGRLVLFGYATFWLGFSALAGTAFLAEPIALPARLDLPFATVRPAGFLFLGGVAAYLALVVLRRRPFVIRGLEAKPPSLLLALGQIAVSSLDWSLAAAVLYSLLPPEWNLSFFHFLGVFLFAQVAGLISHVPGGLGVFETVLLLLLPAALPRPQLLAALVTFRGVYYLLPLLVAAVSLGAHEVVVRRTLVGHLARRVGERAPDVVPPVLAASTFLAGLILLISGSTPAVHSRLSWLDDFLPLPVIEVSHFLGSLAGVGLLFLAAGLQKRLDAAYHLTVLLLASGAVLSLLKGLDWEEALLLTLFLAALLPCHAHFHRRAALTAEPFTPGWIAAIAVALGSSLWLGLFAYKHVDYSTDLWWHFTLLGNAPRFLRASVGTLALALGLALGRLLRPAPPEPQPPSAGDLDQAAAIAARSPRTSSFLALLGDKRLLFHPQGDAFVMFGVERRSWVALGDPVGAEERQADLAWSFRELADRHGGWTVFYQVIPQRLHVYVDLGLSMVKLGEEARVPLAGFSLEGRPRKKLRHAWRRAQDEGLRLEVVPASGIEPLFSELEEVSQEWLRTRNTREKGFSLGRFDRDYLRRFPMALIRQGERIVAFANLWPGGEKEELSIDLMRHREEAPDGVMDFLFVELMLWGREQGYRWFNLGMAPLSGLEERALAPLWNRVGSLVFRHGEHFYNFQGLRQYKEKFDPVWEPRYLACPGGLVLPRVLADIAALIGGGLRGVVGR